VCTPFAITHIGHFGLFAKRTDESGTMPRFGWLGSATLNGPMEYYMIVSTTRITVSPEKRIELFQTIRRLLQPTNEINGCRTFRFYIDTEDENSSLLVSEWDTETSLNEYLHSNDFAVLNGAITVLSTSSVDSKALVTSKTLGPPYQNSGVYVPSLS
jgi:quinol monooxygenase YgiN